MERFRPEWNKSKFRYLFIYNRCRGIQADQEDGNAEVDIKMPHIREFFVWRADYATWTNGVKWSETEILTLIPEMSTPSTE